MQSDCEREGINGNCGEDCVVLQAGECLNGEPPTNLLDGLLTDFAKDGDEEALKTKVKQSMETWRLQDPRGFRTARRKMQKMVEKQQKKEARKKTI